MCEFVSYVEKGNKIYFLTHGQVFNTKKGELLQKFNGTDTDYAGHGAIRFYYGLEQDEGANKECTDFSTPDNFPSVIVRAIKEGKMRRIGIGKGLLNGQAWAEYGKITGQALAEYEKITGQASAEYRKIRDPAFWDLFAVLENRNPLWI